MAEPLTVLFDGVCNVCNATVMFLIDRDPKERLKFASLQSDVGQQLLRERNLVSDLDTVIVIDKDSDRVYSRSSAALRVFRELKFPWPLLYAFVIIPRFIRDYLYTAFATRRYRLFGKSDQCRIPTPELKRRFLA